MFCTTLKWSIYGEIIVGKFDLSLCTSIVWTKPIFHCISHVFTTLLQMLETTEIQATNMDCQYYCPFTQYKIKSTNMSNIIWDINGTISFQYMLDMNTLIGKFCFYKQYLSYVCLCVFDLLLIWVFRSNVVFCFVVFECFDKLEF